MGEKQIILLTLLSILNDLCTKSELKCSRKIKYEYCGTIYTCACAFARKKSALKIILVLSLRRTEERPNVCDSVASFNLCVENVETLTKNNDRSRDFRFQI